MFMWLFYVDVASFFYVHVHTSVSEFLCFRIFDSNEKDNLKNRAKDSSTGVFLSMLENFLEHVFNGTPQDDCFYNKYS